MPQPGGGGGLSLGSDMGGDELSNDVDSLGDIGSDENGEINGDETEIPLEQPEENNQPMESILKNKKLLNEFVNKDKLFLEQFNRRNETVVERSSLYDKALIINDDFNNMIKSLEKIKK